MAKLTADEAHVVLDLMERFDLDLHTPWTNYHGALRREKKYRRVMLRLCQKANDVIDFLKLGHVKNELAGNLSGGQKKLLELGRTMMVDAKVVLLDEVAAGVNRTLLHDLAANIERMNKELGYTFFVIEHDMDLIGRLCDPVIVMAQGEVIAEGSMAEIRANPAIVEAYFGTPVEVA